MVSKRFGSLVVLCQAPKREELKNRARRWSCLCDCGKQTEANGGSLKSGHIKSCGCSRKDFSDRPAFGQLYSNYRCAATGRNYDFDLTQEQFESLVKGPCFYCGVGPSMTYRKRNSSFSYNGVDRKDNSKGYTEENCVSCCGTHNHMKCDMSHEDFIAACRSVVHHFDTQSNS